MNPDWQEVSMAYQFESRVRYSECDEEERLTLPALVDYFQDCSTFQSEAVGNGMREMKRQKKIWMVLSWQIEVLRRPLFGESVISQTWPYGFKAFYGYRNFALLDEKKQYLAKANSVWVLMDAETGRPVRVPQEMALRYHAEPALEMEYLPRKIAVPEGGKVQEPFVVCRHHLDTNHHVNNGQYIYMAEEYLPAGFETARLKVEYRRQAYLHDTVVPVVHRTEQEIMVCLCDREGSPYAIVVFEERSGAKE